MTIKKPGQIIEDYHSHEYQIGDVFTEWDGSTMKVLTKEPTNQFGSWKYRYTYEVLSLGRRHKRSHNA